MKKKLKQLLKPILLPPYRWLRKDRKWFRMLGSVLFPKLITKLLYKRAIGKNLNLKDPQTLNEKCLWLKLNTYYNNPLITECCDKYLVRDYVKSVGCEEILNDLIGVWDNPDDIDFDKLPNKFALKCNHGCGYNIICKDKSKLNVEQTKKQLNKWLKEDYWKLYAETQYKFIKKKIICEKFIEAVDNKLPVDYKFYSVNGRVDTLLICRERKNEKTEKYFFDKNLTYKPEYNFENVENKKNTIDVKEILPKEINKMKAIAENLASNFPFVRVDLYETKSKIFFGELTFLPVGGFSRNKYNDSYSTINLKHPCIS